MDYQGQELYFSPFDTRRMIHTIYLLTLDNSTKKKMQTIRTWAAIKNRDLFTWTRDWSEEWPDLT